MKVLVCDPISATAVQTMRARGLEVDVRDTITAEELLAEIPAYTAMVVRSRTKVTRAVLDAASHLKVIVRGGVGVDNIDVASAQAREVRVMNTPAASTDSVAELTLAYLLALARPIVQATNSLWAGKWEKKKFSGTEIQGKTLGVIGTGRIGKAVARRAAALGMRVLGYDVAPGEPAPYLTMTTLDELLAQSDYLTLHIPLLESTHHLVDADLIAKMKDGVRLIHCGRGGVIDEDALYDALVSGKVAGAALDVFESEPPKDSKLFTLDQVIGSPHVGASTKEATARIGDEVAELLIDFE